MTMISNPYVHASFLQSAAKVRQLPEDSGYEVAFAGRSNAGKSSALNCLTHQRQLARTSKTPGRTQLINLFSIDEQRRLIDLPGYGYAKVSMEVRLEWQRHLAEYLETRQSLRGLVLLMDCRHPLKDLDKTMIDWALARQMPVHVLLTKSDKLGRGEQKNTITKIKNFYKVPIDTDLMSVQCFSSTKKEGLDILIAQLNHWFDL